MDKEMFNAACTAAFGENYAPKVASALFVNERTVRYWANGDRSIPATLQRDVLKMLHSRINEISNALRAMSKVEAEIKRQNGFSDDKFNAYLLSCHSELAGFFPYATVSVRQASDGTEKVTATGTEDDFRSQFTAEEILMNVSRDFQYDEFPNYDD